MADTPRLYVILGSHACRTGMLLLEHKGIDYEPVALPTGMHPLFVRLRGFPGNPGRIRDVGGRSKPLAFADRLGTVPALAMGDERIQTNRRIARFLDRLQPEPPLLPADPELRRQVEEAERWGDETFQMAARRIAIAGVLHGPDALHQRASAGRLGPLLWHHESVRFLGVRALGRFVFNSSRNTEGELLAGLPPMLDRIDAWIGAGVLNGPELNAADFMIGPSVALLSYRRDLSADIEARPAGALMERVLPA